MGGGGGVGYRPRGRIKIRSRTWLKQVEQGDIKVV